VPSTHSLGDFSFLQDGAQIVVQTMSVILNGIGKGLAEGGDPFGLWLWKLPEASGTFVLLLQAYVPGSTSPGFCPLPLHLSPRA
jgi:hypothetical protein